MQAIVRIALSLSASILLAIITVAGIPQAAQAIPSRCSYGNEGSFSWASCTSGTGQFQAWAQCKPRYWWITNWYMSYGPWRSPAPGAGSGASCDGNHQVASYGISYR